MITFTKMTQCSANFIGNSCILPLWKCSSLLNQEWPPPEVVHCADNHFCQAIYSLGPYIGDYPEQTALACMGQIWCPKSVINQFRYSCLCLRSLSRCTAPADDLNGERYPPHSKEHTELISAEFELGQLWDEYGLVGDVVVIIYLFILIFLLIFIS